jgi:hypothetical protein
MIGRFSGDRRLVIADWPLVTIEVIDDSSD